MSRQQVSHAVGFSVAVESAGRQQTTLPVDLQVADYAARLDQLQKLPDSVVDRAYAELAFNSKFTGWRRGTASLGVPPVSVSRRPGNRLNSSENEMETP
jgi:hypothetical protein